MNVHSLKGSGPKGSAATAAGTDRRQAILDATARLINTRGLQSTPMSLIAEDAGVGAGTIYRYFAGKDALVAAVYRELIRDLAEAILDDFSADAPVDERFFALWRGLLGYYQRQPQKTQLLEYLSTSPYIRSLVEEEAFSRLTAHATAVFEDAKAQGLIRDDVDVPTALMFIYGGVTMLAKKGLATPEATESALRMAWEAVRD